MAATTSQLRNLSVNELKDELRKRNIKLVGTKEQLISRLSLAIDHPDLLPIEFLKISTLSKSPSRTPKSSPRKTKSSPKSSPQELKVNDIRRLHHISNNKKLIGKIESFTVSNNPRIVILNRALKPKDKTLYVGRKDKKGDYYVNISSGNRYLIGEIL